MLASIDFAECVLTEVLSELMNGLPSSSRLADLLVQEYIYNTQMVAVALGPWASHSEDRAEP